MPPRRLLFAILLAGLLCRLAYTFFTPIFYAPDEHSHFNYVKHLSEQHSFPVQTTKMGDASNQWEYFQPPLYYLLLVPVYRAAGFLFHNQTAAVFALRLVSILLWLITMRLAVLWLRQLPIKEDLLRIATLSLLSLLPTYTFISAVINNDNLLVPIGGAIVCLLTRRRHTPKASVADAFLLGLLLGLGLLVKQSALVLALAIVLVPALDVWRHRSRLAEAFWPAALPLAVAALIYLPWALRNWRVYGTFTPESLSAVPKVWPSMIYGLASAAHNLIKSFWAVSGIANNIGYPLSAIGLIFMVLALFGLLRRRKQFPDCAEIVAGRLSLFAALGLAVLANIVLVLLFGYQTGMGQGRHLFGLLFPIALALACGSRSLTLQSTFPRVAGFWISYAVAFLVFSLMRFP
jgi:hypothetical protein